MKLSELGLDDDDRSSRNFAKKLEAEQTGLGNKKPGEVLLVADSLEKQPPIKKASVPKGISTLAEDEADCEDLFDMFGVDDSDADDATATKPKSPRPTMSILSGNSVPGKSGSPDRLREGAASSPISEAQSRLQEEEQAYESPSEGPVNLQPPASPQSRPHSPASPPPPASPRPPSSPMGSPQASRSPKPSTPTASPQSRRSLKPSSPMPSPQASKGQDLSPASALPPPTEAQHPDSANHAPQVVPRNSKGRIVSQGSSKANPNPTGAPDTSALDNTPPAAARSSPSRSPPRFPPADPSPEVHQPPEQSKTHEISSQMEQSSPATAPPPSKEPLSPMDPSPHEAASQPQEHQTARAQPSATQAADNHDNPPVTAQPTSEPEISPVGKLTRQFASLGDSQPAEQVATPDPSPAQTPPKTGSRVSPAALSVITAIDEVRSGTARKHTPAPRKTPTPTSVAKAPQAHEPTIAPGASSFPAAQINAALESEEFRKASQPVSRPLSPDPPSEKKPNKEAAVPSEGRIAGSAAGQAPMPFRAGENAPQEGSVAVESEDVGKPVSRPPNPEPSSKDKPKKKAAGSWETADLAAAMAALHTGAGENAPQEGSVAVESEDVGKPMSRSPNPDPSSRDKPKKKAAGSWETAGSAAAQAPLHTSVIENATQRSSDLAMDLTDTRKPASKSPGPDPPSKDKQKKKAAIPWEGDIAAFAAAQAALHTSAGEIAPQEGRHLVSGGGVVAVSGSRKAQDAPSSVKAKEVGKDAEDPALTPKDKHLPKKSSGKQSSEPAEVSFSTNLPKGGAATGGTKAQAPESEDPAYRRGSPPRSPPAKAPQALKDSRPSQDASQKATISSLREPEGHVVSRPTTAARSQAESATPFTWKTTMPSVGAGQTRPATPFGQKSAGPILGVSQAGPATPFNRTLTVQTLGGDKAMRQKVSILKDRTGKDNNRDTSASQQLGAAKVISHAAPRADKGAGASSGEPSFGDMRFPHLPAQAPKAGKPTPTVHAPPSVSAGSGEPSFADGGFPLRVAKIPKAGKPTSAVQVPSPATSDTSFTFPQPIASGKALLGMGKAAAGPEKRQRFDSQIPIQKPKITKPHRTRDLPQKPKMKAEAPAAPKNNFIPIHTRDTVAKLSTQQTRGGVGNLSGAVAMEGEHFGTQEPAGYKAPETAAEYVARMDEPDSDRDGFDEELLHLPFENFDEATQREHDELMAEAREQLRESEGNAAICQQLDSRLERMRMQLEEMHFQALEVRVQMAINANRLVRLDNPIVWARMDALQQQVEDAMRD